MALMRRWLLLMLLSGCASAPATHVYVLSPAVDPAAGVASETGRAVLELRPVRIPDYLDTTDILLRTGSHEIAASRTGMWGERLSIGITGALAGALAQRLPSARIVTGAPPTTAAGRILVDVTALQIRDGVDALLAAHWTVRRGSAEAVSGQGSFVAAAAAGDAGAVAAISRLVDELADAVAATARR